MFFEEEGSAANEVKLFKFIVVNSYHTTQGVKVNADGRFPRSRKPEFSRQGNAGGDKCADAGMQKAA
jgi:hypothetical protein